MIAVNIPTDSIDFWSQTLVSSNKAERPDFNLFTLSSLSCPFVMNKQSISQEKRCLPDVEWKRPVLGEGGTGRVPDRDERPWLQSCSC